jgi:hypothetical protein
LLPGSFSRLMKQPPPSPFNYQMMALDADGKAEDPKLLRLVSCSLLLFIDLTVCAGKCSAVRTAQAAPAQTPKKCSPPPPPPPSMLSLALAHN